MPETRHSIATTTFSTRFSCRRGRDRAVPRFDQPDLKARWTLALDVPQAWQALGNGAELEREIARTAARASACADAADLHYLSLSPPASSRSRPRSATAARSGCSIARPTQPRSRATATRSSTCTRAALAWLEQLHRHPVSVRQVRLRARARVPVRRHGAPRRDLLQRRRRCCSTSRRRRTRCSIAPASSRTRRRTCGSATS